MIELGVLKLYCHDAFYRGISSRIEPTKLGYGRRHRAH
jgi:hypothetical protein